MANILMEGGKEIKKKDIQDSLLKYSEKMVNCLLAIYRGRRNSF